MEKESRLNSGKRGLQAAKAVGKPGSVKAKRVGGGKSANSGGDRLKAKEEEYRYVRASAHA
jgi:hypothetical protein